MPDFVVGITDSAALEVHFRAEEFVPLIFNMEVFGCKIGFVEAPTLIAWNLQCHQQLLWRELKVSAIVANNDPRVVLADQVSFDGGSSVRFIIKTIQHGAIPSMEAFA